MYESILVPTDGSALSDAAIREAAKLAKELGSKLVLFYAVPYYYYPLPPLTKFAPPDSPKNDEQAKKAMEDDAKQVLAYAAEISTLAGLNVEQKFAVNNSPYAAILDAVEKFRCELIVMASHGRRGLSSVLLGSETQKVLTHSTVPVLVVR